jgi:dephospho-CoA kinase
MLEPLSDTICVIGLTGGIGSGKSTAAGIIKRRFPVLDSDAVARSVLHTDEHVRASVLKLFGDRAFRSDGTPDTAFLAEAIFSGTQVLKKVNAIIHPAVIRGLRKTIAEFDPAEIRMVFVESAIIFEAGLQGLFHYVLSIICDKDIAVNRVVESGRLKEEDIRNRMKQQLKNEDKAGKSDFVIVNDGTLEELSTRIEFIVSIIERSCSAGT